MKVYDSQGRLKTIAAAASVEPTSGQFSALSNQVSVADAALSVAINVVSNGLSNLTSIHDVLSNRVSANSAIGGAGSVTSTEASAISAQAASAIASEVSNRTSADNALSVAIQVVSNAVSVVSVAAAAAEVHASTASAAATSVLAGISAVSARTSTGGAVSIHGLQSVVNALSAQISNEQSIRLVSVQTASAAATSADAHANTVSGRVVSVSAELASLVQIASAAATSADGHAATASAAATSADAHANTVSARAVSVSAELASLVQIASAAATSVDARVNSVNVFISGISARSVGGVSTHGFQSVVDALSNRISATAAGVASVTSNELSAVQASVNAISNRLSTVSALSEGLSVKGLQSAVNALSHGIASINAVISGGGATSGLVSVDAGLHNRISALCAALSAVSTVSAAGTAIGLQSVINALSNRISAVTGGSVTSNEASAISAQAASAINVVSARVVSVSAELASLVQIASAAATSADGHANTVSAALSADHYISLQNVDTISLVYGMPVYAFTSANTMKRADVSAWNNPQTQVIGLVADAVIAVSAVGAIRTRGTMVFTSAQIRSVATLSGFTPGNSYYLTGTGQIGLSEPSGNVGVMKIGTGLDTRTLLVHVGHMPADQNLSNQISVLSQGISIVSARVVSVSAELASLIQIASAAATSADGHANTVSARVVSVSAEMASLVQIASAAATSADGHANTVSAEAAAASVTLVSVQSTVSHLASIVSLVSTVSGGGTAVGLQSVINALSNRISAIPGGGSTNAVARVSVANVICAAVLTDISGLGVSVSAGAVYRLEGMMMYSVSAGTGMAFGLTFPAMTHAGGEFIGATSVPLTGASTVSSYIVGPFDEGDTGSAVWSAAVGATGTHMIRVDGVLVPSAGGVVRAQARASVATNAVTIQPGSYMRVFKLS